MECQRPDCGGSLLRTWYGELECILCGRSDPTRAAAQPDLVRHNPGNKRGHPPAHKNWTTGSVLPRGEPIRIYAPIPHS